MINIPCTCSVDLVNLWRECDPRRRYISDLETNLAKLRDERDRLIAKKNASESEINDAKFSGMEATETLTGWIQRVDTMEAKLGEILGKQLPERCGAGGGGCSCCCCCCYYSLEDCKFAYKLGRSVAEKLVEAKDLREESLNKADMFVRVNKEYLPVRDAIGMETIFQDVWNWLVSSNEFEEQNSRIARVCGMGGVGKTTLLKKLNNNFFVERHDFNYIIFVDAGESKTVESIQRTICEKLGHRHDRTGIQGNIYQELMKKKFVLFIDDPHQDLTLDNIGIPTHHKGAKIVFATRNKTTSMGIGGDGYHKFTVGLLNAEDAQKLFDETVGVNILNLDEEIRHLANSITRLCDGLPITLLTIGRAMLSMETPGDWQHEERMLRKLARDFEGMDRVYGMFQVSYNALNDTARWCFLYSSLFPKDASIEAEQLIQYWIGESFFHVNKLEDIRRLGRFSLNTLRAANLLETGEDVDVVSMQETIRASAHWIAAKSGVGENNFWVQSNVELPQLPNDVNLEEVERISLVRCHLPNLNLTHCSNLSTLILRDSIFGTIFFQQMTCLKVLDLSRCNLDSFPEGITALVTLQYLNLSYTYIKELPVELKKLTKLKILDLSFMKKLQTIPPNVIRSLLNLQVFNMYSSGFENRIPDESVLGRNGPALLQELQSLDYLEDIRITVAHIPSLESLSYLKNSLTNSLFITKCEGSITLHSERMYNLTRLHIFECPYLNKIWVGGRFTNLLHVEIEDCWGLKSLNWLRFAPALQSLKVIKCTILEEVISDVDTSSEAETHQRNGLFSKLRSIHLSHLPELRSIHNSPLPFPCLKEISVLYCPNMVKLPLHENSAKETLKFIRGHEKWWATLSFWKTDDGEEIEDVKLRFEKYLIPIP